MARAGLVPKPQPLHRNVQATEKMQWSPIEMMLILAARQIRDREVLFVGTYWPLIVATLAKKIHAPDAILIFEGGLVCESLSDGVPFMTTDPYLVSNATLCGDCVDSLQILQQGYVTTALLSASAIDKYGNVNTTCVGDYSRPEVRLAGSGGASDIMALARVMVILEQNSRRFPEKVDYVTSPGFLSGGNARMEAGLKMGTGPDSVITTMGIFRFDSERHEMYLAAIFPGSNPKKVRESVQWDLRVAESLKHMPPPTEYELKVLREEVDPHRIFLR